MEELRPAVERFFQEYNTPNTLYMIEDADWTLINVYTRAVFPFVKASRLLGGENYPTGSSVIPYLDEVSLSKV